MQYQKLGTSDIEVSRLCMGTMNFSSQVEQSEAFAILDAAFDGGFNFIDTAEMYAVPPRPDIQGIPEQWVGQWMKGRSRDKVILATKVTGPGQMGWILENRVPPSPSGPTKLDRASILAAAEGCLQRLDTDYIDLFQVHWAARYVGGLFGDMRYRPELEREPSADFDEIAGTMDELIKAGKIRTWGTSNETSYGLCKYDEACRANGYANSVSIQNDFSLMNRSFEPELAETCAPRNLDIGLLVYGGLAGGTLSGKYRRQETSQGRHVDYPNFQPRYFSKPALTAAHRYADLAEENGMTPTELAIAWMLEQRYVASVITGASRAAQVDEQVSATQKKLSKEVLDAVEVIHAENQNPCNYAELLPS